MAEYSEFSTGYVDGAPETINLGAGNCDYNWLNTHRLHYSKKLTAYAQLFPKNKMI